MNIFGHLLFSLIQTISSLVSGTMIYSHIPQSLIHVKHSENNYSKYRKSRSLKYFLITPISGFPEGLFSVVWWCFFFCYVLFLFLLVFHHLALFPGIADNFFSASWPLCMKNCKDKLSLWMMPSFFRGDYYIFWKAISVGTVYFNPV